MNLLWNLIFWVKSTSRDLLPQIPPLQRFNLFYQKHQESQTRKHLKIKKKEPKTQKNKQTTINQSFSTAATIDAEICWVLNIVYTKHCMNSLSNSGALFTAMFPDSEITKRFKCEHTKACYVAHFGLAPYFNDIFYSQISTAHVMRYLLMNL